MTLSLGVAIGDLLLLPVLLTPLGDLVFLGGRRILGFKPRLPPLERALLDFYLAGGLYLLTASIGIAWFTSPFILAALILGDAAWLMAVGRHWIDWPPLHLRDLTARVLQAFARDYGITTAIGLVLMIFELLVNGSSLFPNTFDGSEQVIFVVLIRHLGQVPWTLEPYAPFGVEYPQGTAVWLDLAGTLFSWPVIQLPILLPPLFIGMTPLAVAAWSGRVVNDCKLGKRPVQWLMAGAVGAILTWPRFLVSGSYDFLLALPLFILAWAWGKDIITIRGSGLRRIIVAYGGVLAILTSLSLVASQGLLTILLVSGLVHYRDSLRLALKWVGTLCLVAVLGLALVVRSIIGYAVWWGYPHHVLTATGGPLPSPPPLGPLWGILVGLTDPFLTRPQDVWLSPFPQLRIVLQVLLVISIVMVILRVAQYGPLLKVAFPAVMARELGIAILSMIGFLGLLTVVQTILGVNAYLPTLPEEVSILLFMFYTIFAFIPLVISVLWLADPRSSTSPLFSRVRRGSQGAVHLLAVLAALTLLVVPFSVGTVVTITQGPPYLQAIDHDLSNETQGDVLALEWASHLPSCSNVLVAPGSVGQYLPDFANVHLTYPMDPDPENYSYQIVVEALSEGNYTNRVQVNLLALGITEVFVSGQNNILFPAFEASLLLQSPDFDLLFHSQDAYWFAFLPGVNQQDCPPGPMA
jgi:hypothetical protein